MPCLLGCLALLTPRVVIVLLALFTHYIDHAYDSFIWPLLGFFFLPTTTLGYAVAANEFAPGSPLGWVLIGLGLLLDLGFLGGGSWGVSQRG